MLFQRVFHKTKFLQVFPKSLQYFAVANYELHNLKYLQL